MRTTLDIDDDILSAAKELARQEHLTAGQVVSRLLRSSLTGRPAGAPGMDNSRTMPAAGFRPFGSGCKIVTNDEINALRDQEGV